MIEKWKKTTIGSIYTTHGALVASVHGDLTKNGDEYFEALRLRSNTISRAPEMKALLDELVDAEGDKIQLIRSRAIALVQWIDTEGKQV